MFWIISNDIIPNWCCNKFLLSESSFAGGFMLGRGAGALELVDRNEWFAVTISNLCFISFEIRSLPTLPGDGLWAPTSSDLLKFSVLG